MLLKNVANIKNYVLVYHNVLVANIKFEFKILNKKSNFTSALQVTP